MSFGTNITSDEYFFAAHVTLQKGASVHLVFGFEYAVLILLVATILVKYILHLIDLRHENQWANKTIYLLYTELVIGAVKVCLISRCTPFKVVHNLFS